MNKITRPQRLSMAFLSYLSYLSYLSSFPDLR